MSGGRVVAVSVVIMTKNEVVVVKTKVEWREKGGGG